MRKRKYGNEGESINDWAMMKVENIWIWSLNEEEDGAKKKKWVVLWERLGEDI